MTEEGKKGLALIESSVLSVLCCGTKEKCPVSSGIYVCISAGAIHLYVIRLWMVILMMPEDEIVSGYDVDCEEC